MVIIDWLKSSSSGAVLSDFWAVFVLLLENCPKVRQNDQ